MTFDIDKRRLAIVTLKAAPSPLPTPLFPLKRDFSGSTMTEENCTKPLFNMTYTLHIYVLILPHHVAVADGHLEAWSRVRCYRKITNTYINTTASVS